MATSVMFPTIFFHVTLNCYTRNNSKQNLNEKIMQQYSISTVLFNFNKQIALMNINVNIHQECIIQ